MLVLSRKRDESVVIGDDCRVTIVGVRGERVRLGFDCPPDVTVHRHEVAAFIAAERKESPEVSHDEQTQSNIVLPDGVETDHASEEQNPTPAAESPEQPAAEDHFRPLHEGVVPKNDNVIVREIKPPTTTRGGIELPATAVPNGRTGVVLAVGPGRWSAGGTRIVPDVAVGKVVLFSPHNSGEIRIGGESLLTMSELNIVCELPIELAQVADV